MTMMDESALKIAEFLLKIKAVKLQPSKPFTWASGLKSPIYCDNRITLSFPNVRTYIRQQFAELIAHHFAKPDVIVGVATGGIAHGALVAEEMGLPFAYVRSEAKSHGMKNLIEGIITEGQDVVVVEDLVSTGKSSLNAVNALQEIKCNVKGMVAIFSYQFNESEEKFRKAKIPLVTLSNYNTLIEIAVEKNYISAAELESLREWRNDPKTWSQKHS
ncbi:MAG: orotate phosphoribosyltransferase [Flavobacteriales bacterium]